MDVIAAEDTRRTGKLLQLLDIETARANARMGGSGAGRPSLVSHHEHNTRRRVPDLVARCRAGASVAVVSDAGTPGIADPGMQLAQACAEAGVRVVPVPGPCAAVAALSVAGFPCAEFVFFGFLPRKGAALQRKAEELAAEPRTCVFYEAPHRALQTASVLAGASAAHATRQVLVARELTKLHEELFRGTLAQWAAHLEARPPRGEFTVVLAALEPKGAVELAEEAEESLDAAARDVASMVASGAQPLSSAVKEVAKASGVSKKELYKRALEDREK